MVRDGAADDVGHIPMILFLREALFGVAVEAPQGSEMHIAAEDGDADGVFRRDLLKGVNKFFALVLVLPCGIVIIEIVEEIGLAVKFVEEAPRDAKALVEEFEGPDEG